MKSVRIRSVERSRSVKTVCVCGNELTNSGVVLIPVNGGVSG
jgi:hypothetical protein